MSKRPLNKKQIYMLDFLSKTLNITQDEFVDCFRTMNRCDMRHSIQRFSLESFLAKAFDKAFDMKWFLIWICVVREVQIRSRMKLITHKIDFHEDLLMYALKNEKFLMKEPLTCAELLQIRIEIVNREYSLYDWKFLCESKFCQKQNENDRVILQLKRKCSYRVFYIQLIHALKVYKISPSQEFLHTCYDRFIYYHEYK